MLDETFDYGLAPGERFEPDEEGEEPFDLAQPHVMTALGPIAPDDLGFTLYHARVIDDPALALAELKNASSVGLRAVVDLTAAVPGRDLFDVVWVAQRAPVHVVLATGAGAFGDPAVGMVEHLTDGIGASEARAGLIAVTTRLDQITPDAERLLRAASQAHRATGAPIWTLSAHGAMALDQIALFRQEGVDLSRVVVGPFDITLDERFLGEVLETGVSVSFDRVGDSETASDELRAALVKRLVDAGHAGQVLLSGDMARLMYLIEQFPIVLMEAGLDAPTVRRLFVDNPARALTIRR